MRLSKPSLRAAPAARLAALLGLGWVGCGGPGPEPRFVDLSAFANGPRVEISATEITVAQYARFAAATGRPAPEGKAREPVRFVSRGDAEAYARWLSECQGRVVRLPTGAEWEAAARAGIIAAPYPWGWGPPEGRCRFRTQGPAPVASFPPNPWGLYDMAGNVAEWVSDEGPGGSALIRGGAWSERADTVLRVDRSLALPSDYRDADVGFRLVREFPP